MVPEIQTSLRGEMIKLQGEVKVLGFSWGVEMAFNFFLLEPCLFSLRASRSSSLNFLNLQGNLAGILHFLDPPNKGATGLGNFQSMCA